MNQIEWVCPNAIMESVFNIAESGNGYLAVERSGFVVRKLKQEGKVNEAVLFLMQLAELLLKKEQYHSSAVAALKAVNLFPKSASTILIAIKNRFTSFILDAPKEMSCPEMFDYIGRVIDILGDKEFKFSLKRISIAFAAGHFSFAQLAVCQLFSLSARAMKDETFDYGSVIETLASISAEWLTTLSTETYINTGQFIVARPAVVISYLDQSLLPYAKMYLECVGALIPDPVKDTCGFRFANFIIKAAEKNDNASIVMIIKKYQPMLQLDKFMLKAAEGMADMYKTGTTDNQGPPAIGNLIQNLLSSIFPQENQ